MRLFAVWRFWREDGSQTTRRVRPFARVRRVDIHVRALEVMAWVPCRFAKGCNAVDILLRAEYDKMVCLAVAVEHGLGSAA